MEDFKVTINNVTYYIKFTDKNIAINTSITRIHQNNITLLENQKYNKLITRIYYYIKNIEKLKDGRIRKYRVFNELELKTISSYLTNKNILFRILENNTHQLYSPNIDGIYELNKESSYAEENKFFKKSDFYIQVYKGFINLLTQKREYKSPDGYVIPTIKYGIYLWDYAAKRRVKKLI